MTRLRTLFGVLLVLCALWPATLLAAQGVTSGALVGYVTDQEGGRIASASVTLTNTSTGQRYATRTDENGRYFFENLQVGGPYVLEVRALGFEPAQTPNIRLNLGQRLVNDVPMKRAAVEVSGITVTAEPNPLINAARTGAQAFVSETALTRLPSLSRNFTDFIATVPQVVAASVPGATIGGQNNRFNNIQIDGGVNNDVFGLAASGTPGGQADAHPISIEALKEYQVLIAPFDVRQGSFTGGLINAVTKSGTNSWRGSLFGYLQNENFVGKDLQNRAAAEFNQSQYGATVGGPILRDRVHIFASADLQSRDAPFVGELASTATGVTPTTADRVRQILRDSSRYGFDPGGWQAPTLGNPDKNFFGKLTAQLATNNQLELSHNFVDSEDDNLIRNARATGFRDGYQLANSGYFFSTVTNTTRAKWNAQLASRFSNELLVGYQTIRDKRNLPNRVPLILVGGDVSGRTIGAGADRFSHDNSLDQDIIEVTDNVTFAAGEHLITVGTHNEFFHFLNHFFPASLGVWSFTDTTALKTGTPNRYEIALPLRPGGPTADFKVQQYGFYMQDRWTAAPRLTLTAGVRVDIPRLEAPVYNLGLDTTMGINTADFPSGNALWSPRLGFNYDVTGNGTTSLRGGVGIFSGRPPYVWISNAYGNTGREQVTLICDGVPAPPTTQTDTVPTFTVDPNNQPTFCGQQNDPSDARSAAASVVYFDSDFRFPQNFKAALGLDHQLPWGIVGTFDFLFTRAVNQFFISDVNLAGIQGFAAGEGGRPLYGTLSATSGSATPVRLTSSFRDVLRHRNESRDRTLQVTAQLQKRFSDNLEFNVGYTYSHVEDVFSLTSSIAFSNYRFTALDGTLDDRNLRRSVFDIPHKITASGTVALPWGVRASLIYIGQSGHPYTYMIQNDGNADGVTSNDIIYIPANRADASVDGNGGAVAGFGTAGQQDSVYALLDSFINGEDCLREHRGRLLTRNSCRNQWLNFVNARFVGSLPTIAGQSAELSLDVFNLLHLLNKDWGVVHEVSDFEQLNMLERTGFDATAQRGIYAISGNALPNRDRVTSARWRIQLGVKYLF